MSELAVEKSVYDADAVRAQFPILHREVHGKPLVYLDNAASTQKPQVVIDALDDYYSRLNANVHRGVHRLSQEATDAYEYGRKAVGRLLGVDDDRQIVFTRGTTEAINLVAMSWGMANLGEGDEIVLSGMEHHSNIVPWQLVAQAKGAVIKVLPIGDDGAIVPGAAEDIIGPRTKLLGITHVSNALGTINPVRELADLAHAQGAVVLVDGAQAAPHVAIDVDALGADFYAISGHKIYAPTGIGALYGKAELLEAMPPWQGGGEMIRSVSFEKTTYAPIPAKFEAGTPHIAGAVGLGAAIDWLLDLGLDAVAAHEDALLAYATEQLLALPGVRIIGTAPHKAGVASFVVDGAHPHDIGTFLDMAGVAIRTGHHCAQPVMTHFGIPATARASFAAYNTRSDVDALIKALGRVIEVFAR
ncbi:MAG: cysteine desulfurase [Deltaproteobacteria bacterium]|nr:MAG: cysteine desulfurase [Deltaproteobacteria bacterium]